MAGKIEYRNCFSMGTRLDMVLPDVHDEVADGFANEVRKNLAKLEDEISIYKENSVFSALNKQAYKSSIPLEKHLFYLIRDLKALSLKTMGYFDFTIGKLSDWKKIYAVRQTDSGMFLSLLAELGEKQVLLDQEAMTVSYATDKVFLDSGAFGKGLGLDMIRQSMQSWRIDAAFISFGESSILAHGEHPHGKSWKTGIRHIFDENESVYAFDLHNDVLSVSGITPDNMKKYGGGHIMNPLTGQVIEEFRQAAVAGPAGLITEALSTALLCAPQEAYAPIMESFPGYRATVIGYDEKQLPNIIFTTKN